MKNDIIKKDFFGIGIGYYSAKIFYLNFCLFSVFYMFKYLNKKYIYKFIYFVIY